MKSIQINKISETYKNVRDEYFIRENRTAYKIENSGDIVNLGFKLSSSQFNKFGTHRVNFDIPMETKDGGVALVGVRKAHSKAFKGQKCDVIAEEDYVRFLLEESDAKTTSELIADRTPAWELKRRLISLEMDKAELVTFRNITLLKEVVLNHLDDELDCEIKNTAHVIEMMNRFEDPSTRLNEKLLDIENIDILEVDDILELDLLVTLRENDVTRLYINGDVVLTIAD